MNHLTNKANGETAEDLDSFELQFRDLLVAASDCVLGDLPDIDAVRAAPRSYERSMSNRWFAVAAAVVVAVGGVGVSGVQPCGPG